MWSCPKCRTEVEDEFPVCWYCGTTADGVEDPTFARDDSQLFCYVCNALGEWEMDEEVPVCPGCRAGTTADPDPLPWYRRNRIFVGYLAGYPVFAEPSLLLFALLLLVSVASWPIVASLILAIVCHELGHAVAGRATGLGKGSVTIAPWGGYYLPDAPGTFTAPRTARQRRAVIAVAAAGPLTNLLLAALGWTAARALHTGAFADITRLNLIMGLGNLVPIPPLDGGRIALAALTRTYEARCRLYRICAFITGTGFVALMLIPARVHADWRFSGLAPLLGLLALACAAGGAEKRGEARWRAVRLEREQKANREEEE